MRNTVFFLVAVYFFFQAEDGIRDRLVTGVQTCALPILTKKVCWKLVISTKRLSVKPDKQIRSTDKG